MKRIGFCGLVFTAFALTAWPETQTAGTSQKKTIEKTPITHTSATSGQEMYMSYCAACHGKAGKGDGPAASALKEPPPDLTTLAKRNNGKFPGEHVVNILRFGTPVPAHGTSDMPVWGPLFGSLHGVPRNAGIVEIRISNLTTYIESLQVK